MRLHGERDVVQRGEIEEQRGDLERARQPELATAPARQRRDIAAVEANAPGVGHDLAGELADQRGLAGAVRADDGVQFAARHLEHNVSQATTPPKRLVKPSICQRGSGTAPPRQQPVDAAARDRERSAAERPSTICQYSPHGRHRDP